MAQFWIELPSGDRYIFEGSLLHAQQELHKHQPGAKLSLLHPGTSGHGTSGLDY